MGNAVLTTKTPTSAPPEAVAPLEQEVSTLTRAPLPRKISSAEEFASFGEELKSINLWLKKWNELHNPVIAAANLTHTLALRARDSLGNPAETRRKGIAQLLGAYNAEQTRIALARAAEERRVREAADREQRENDIREARERQEQAKLKQQRLEAVATAARQLVHDTSDIEQQAELLDEAESAIREANDRAMEAGYGQQEVEALIVAPLPPAFVEVRSEVPKVEGLSLPTNWFAEVVDPEKYMAHLLANYQRNKVLIAGMLEKAMPALNREAVTTKQEIEIVPGVFARPKYGASART